MTANRESHENRKYRRSKVRWPLIYSPFSSSYVPSVDATASNCSDLGLCFRSPYPLCEGQYVFIRTRPEFPASVSDEPPAVRLKSHSLAQVRWCMIESFADTPVYSIGVEYL